MNADKFAKYRPKESVTTNEMPTSEQKKDAFEKYRPKPESWGQFGKRIAAQTVARPIEAVGTIPGNLLRFLSDYGITAAESLSGQQFPEFRKGLEQTAPFKLLPSSEQGRKISSQATGGLTEPQGELEEAYSDALGLSTLLLSASSNPKAWQSLVKSVGIGTSATGAKKVAKALGFEETGQNMAELGTVLIGSLYNPRGIQKWLGKAYDKLGSSPVAKNIVPTTDLSNSLGKLKLEWTKGGTSPAERSAMTKLDELEKVASKGNVEVDELLEAYKKVNAEIQSRDLFDKLDRAGKAKLRGHYDELKGELSKTFEKYTPKDFYDQWKDINQGYSTFAKSRTISDFVRKNRDIVLKGAGSGILADLYFAIGAAGPAAVGTGGAIAATKTGEMLYRIANSPTLRKYYVESLEHLSKENLPAAMKSIEKLKSSLEKED